MSESPEMDEAARITRCYNRRWVKSQILQERDS